jgi:hypothetical protein
MSDRIINIEQTLDVFSSDVGNDIADYVASNDITLTVSARWIEEEYELHSTWGSLTKLRRYRLSDWTILSVNLNGVLLTDSNMPSAFPMQAVIQAMDGKPIREQLESLGPKARRK